MPGYVATALVVLAAVVVAIGLGGRAAAPVMADTDCWKLGGGEGIAIRVFCAGDTDLGGWCAGLQSSSSDELNPAAAGCAFPALVFQEIPFAVVAVISLVIAGVLMLPVALAAQDVGRRRV